jgi:branched-chain amino acid transport system ATP-binding protein
MLILNNIEVSYVNVIIVLKGVSFSVSDNKIVSLLGANGAGKSTTLKAISGLLGTEEGKVTDGDIEFDGMKIHRKEPEDIVKQGIIQVMEGHRLFEHLTIEEDLKLGSCYGSQGGKNLKSDMERVFNYFPRLRDMRHRVTGLLSGGEQQMVVTGRALMGHPKLMLLDEPSLGLAPLIVKEIFRVIKKINDEEKTAILLVEQNAVAALEITEYCYVMENGRIVMDGEASKMRENEDIKEFYLGLSNEGSRKSFAEIKHYRRRKRWLG